MANRRILCLGDPNGMSLLTVVKLLARAIVEHIHDYAVVVDPTGTSYYYMPGLPPTTIATPDMATAETQAGVVYGLVTKNIHFLVVDTVTDAALSLFLGAPGAFFDVVTPFVAYWDKFLPLPGNIATWLLPSGRAMPVIMLPMSTTGNAGPARFFAIDNSWNAPNPPERDACRMRFTPAQVNSAAMIGTWALVDAATRATFERWARTVTWKRVGICISGGGASVFRLSHLFEALEAKGLPIDLLAGVSGGSAFAACYAVGGMPKLHALANRGLSMSVAFAGSLISSRTVKTYMDDFFGGCGVCNTEIRFVAMCTALPPKAAPHPTIAMDGTMGDAIRASGGAPFIGPYFAGNTRQTDGAIIAGLPPPLLAERFGADIVFAMNVLSLPKNRFPGESIPVLGNVLDIFYRFTPLGRIADTWSATSTMLHTISEGAGLQADVFFDAPPRNGAPIEQALLYNSIKYFNEGLDGLSAADLNAIADDFVLRWHSLT